ncbi:MAG: glycosyltransferase family 39 protein [Beijerinckiaceae bacterium]|nr:glycosyltransferase family 39 protein [Beijerinckiaceae bacterium]MCZ8301370.1 glycosyltransferase family 39 protein [Beijerinckiaceae bacterium]
MPNPVSALFQHDWRGVLHALTRTHRRAILALVLVSACFFLPGQMSLQPMDRDEPRFAQASKQMLETGDFVDIRFQEEARHKKPVGIYWLQSATVSIGEWLGVPDARRTIGLYRVPSFLGAMAMVLLTYWAALAFLSREGALLAALMMAGSVLLGVEARLAKTDAVLGALSVAAFGFMARAYLASRSPGIAPGLTQRHLVLFWLAMGAAVLVKGPITPLVAALAIAVLVWRDRELGWARGMRPGLGLLIVALVVLPWLSLMLAKAGSSFFAESLGKDMLAKVGSAQEKHGAPPGTYLGVFWVTFWPAAPLALLAIPFAWRERRDDGVAFLLAWIVPFWLILEAVPTKLPHYVLPVYPAIAILIMIAAERSGLMQQRWARALAGFLLLLVPLVFLIGVPGLFLLLEEGLTILRLPFLALPFLVVAFAAAAYGTWMLVRQARPVRALVAGLAAGLMLTLAAYPNGLPMLKAFNLSPRLAEAARATGCASPAYATVGYREPSLVFLTATDLLMTDAAGAAAFIDREGEGCRIAFIERASEEAFRAALQGRTAPALVTRVRGVNINAALDKQRRLRVLDIAVYVRR